MASATIWPTPERSTGVATYAVVVIVVALFAFIAIGIQSSSSTRKPAHAKSQAELWSELTGRPATEANVQVLAEWGCVLTRIGTDGAAFAALVRQFFLRDNIGPRAFLLNHAALGDGGRPHLVQQAPLEHSPSIGPFLRIIDRPPYYPSWFLAGYPDVALWATSNSRGNRAFSESLALECSMRLTELQNNADLNVLPPELHGGPRPIEFRALIDVYQSKTAKQLECRA
jgi:hypothetical protein